MRSIRDQRLSNDYEELIRLARQLNQGGCTKLEVTPTGGRPYQAYNLYFHCAAYVDELGTVRQRHQLFLEFPRAYPLEAPPTFKRVSPLFHPNIYPHGVFCLGFEGERKWRSGISLESLVLHVSRLIRFDPDWVNLDPPANRTQNFWQDWIAKYALPTDSDPFVLGDEPEISRARSAPERAEESPRQIPTPPARRAIRIGTNRTSPGADPDAPPSGGARRQRPSGPIRISRNAPGS